MAGSVSIRIHAVKKLPEFRLGNPIERVDAILTNVERSVANVDSMKYKGWATKIKFQ